MAHPQTVTAPAGFTPKGGRVNLPLYKHDKLNELYSVAGSNKKFEIGKKDDDNLRCLFDVTSSRALKKIEDFELLFMGHDEVTFPHLVKAFAFLEGVKLEEFWNTLRWNILQGGYNRASATHDAVIYPGAAYPASTNITLPEDYMPSEWPFCEDPHEKKK